MAGKNGKVKAATAQELARRVPRKPYEKELYRLQAELMKVQLRKLEDLLLTLGEQQAPDQELLVEVERARAILQSSWNEYRRQLPGDN